MNKTLLATVACGSALAQSGMNLYGNVDASLVTISSIRTTPAHRKYKVKATSSSSFFM